MARPCDPPIQRPWPDSGHSEEQSEHIGDDERSSYEADRRHERRLRRWARRDEWRRRISTPGAWIFVAAAALEVAGLGLQSANIPNHWWGEKDDRTVLDYVVTIAGAVGVMLSAFLAAAYDSLANARQTDRRLEELARSIAREVREITQIPIEIISVHVWELQDPRVWLILPRWFPRRPSVEHLARRAAHVPERREHEPISFLKGMGVVGRCWQRRREVVEDLGYILTRAPDAAAYYANFGYEQRFRLSFANLWNTRRFWAIWAYPVFVGPPGAKEFGGAVTVDIQCPGYADELRAVADNRTEELDSLLVDCAALLRGELPAS